MSRRRNTVSFPVKAVRNRDNTVYGVLWCGMGHPCYLRLGEHCCSWMVEVFAQLFAAQFHVFNRARHQSRWRLMLVMITMLRR